MLPDEVLIGHFERYIAHKVVGKHLIRAVYEYVGALPVLITVYLSTEPLAETHETI